MTDPSRYARSEAHRNWERVRQAAISEDLLSLIGFRKPDLLSFEEVQRGLRLHHKSYKGLQDIPLDQIRGSVGRYRDFTQSFMPRNPKMRDRWERVNAVAIDRGLPPIEVYKVGDAYFVLDGNHRVSVALGQGGDTIQAHVWEFSTPLGLSAEADLDEVITKAEYADFLETTGLSALRPDAEIIFTLPGRYRELEYQIHLYQQALTQIDGEPCSWEDAVTAWYDMVYTPAIMIMKERGLLDRFPDRTEADLFIWIWRYSRELRSRGEDASLGQIAEDAEGPGFWNSLNNFFNAVKNFLKGDG
jgi:hypothetical protein